MFSFEPDRQSSPPGRSHKMQSSTKKSKSDWSMGCQGKNSVPSALQLDCPTCDRSNQPIKNSTLRSHLVIQSHELAVSIDQLSIWDWLQSDQIWSDDWAYKVPASADENTLLRRWHLEWVPARCMWHGMQMRIGYLFVGKHRIHLLISCLSPLKVMINVCQYIF
jgi:hypothetical protein